MTRFSPSSFHAGATGSVSAFGGDLLELGFQTRFIDRSVQTGIAAVSHRADDRCHARERPALAADLPCVFRRLDIVYAAQNILDRNIIIRIMRS